MLMSPIETVLPPPAALVETRCTDAELAVRHPHHGVDDSLVLGDERALTAFSPPAMPPARKRWALTQRVAVSAPRDTCAAASDATCVRRVGQLAAQKSILRPERGESGLAIFRRQIRLAHFQ